MSDAVPMTDQRPGRARDTPEASETELLDALAVGDRQAAEQLVARSYRRVYRALVRWSGDPELAQDLTQETYRKVWRSLASFDGRSRFATWAYRIAYTTYLNHLRRPHRLSPFDEEAAAALPDPAPGQEEVLDRSRQALRLRRAVTALPEPLRFTVSARFWGELPVREIARQEGISSVAVRKRLRRAFEILGESLEESAHGEEGP